MDRAKLSRIIHKLDEALCALQDVRVELIEVYGDDCGSGLAVGSDAPHGVRRMLRRLADRSPVSCLVSGSVPRVLSPVGG